MNLFHGPGKTAVENIVNDEDQEQLKETVEDVSEKVKADLRAGELKALFSDQEEHLDLDNVEYRELDPVFTCSIGSIIQNNACGECHF